MIMVEGFVSFGFKVKLIKRFADTFLFFIDKYDPTWQQR